MSNFVFKETTVKSMKIAGILDTASMKIEIDGEEKDLNVLLSPFDDAGVEISVKVKDEQELEEPVGDLSEEDL